MPLAGDAAKVGPCVGLDEVVEVHKPLAMPVGRAGVEDQ